MTASVEVEQGGLRGGGFGIVVGLGVAEGFHGGIVAVYVGLVVLGVVELHDLAGDVRLEGRVVVLYMGVA